MVAPRYMLLLISTCCSLALAKYLPTWESLDARQLPSWYDEGKLGIFIHWGVFSVPSFHNEWFWWRWKGGPSSDVVNFMKKNYRPDFTYADFAKQFTAEFFNPSDWAKLFEEAGAKFVVLTSKHHDGYTNWPSKYSFNWNSKAVGPNRDLVGDLANAIRSRGKLRFGVYHSLYEWFHPLYLADKKSGYKTQDFVKTKTMPELYELVTSYKPEVVWSDGQWMATAEYWQSKKFVAWLYNDSPVNATVVINDRWGKDTICHHGGYYTCRSRYNPGYLIEHKWENSMTMDRYSWGYRRTTSIKDVLSIEEILKELISTVSCNGNLLLNVGPTHDGMITPIYQERLLQLGSWLKVNGEGIYGSRPWTFQNDTVTPGVWYTSQRNTKPPVVYAFLLQWPDKGQVYLASPKPTAKTAVSLVGFKGSSLKWVEPFFKPGILVNIPSINVKQMPCQWAWTLKITNLQN